VVVTFIDIGGTGDRHYSS